MGKQLALDEVIEEVDWLLGGGMTAYQICAALGKSPGALYKAAWRAGRKDLESLFSKIEHIERRVSNGKYWEAE